MTETKTWGEEAGIDTSTLLAVVHRMIGATLLDDRDARVAAFRCLVEGLGNRQATARTYVLAVVLAATADEQGWHHQPFAETRLAARLIMYCRNEEKLAEVWHPASATQVVDAVFDLVQIVARQAARRMV